MWSFFEWSVFGKKINRFSILCIHSLHPNGAIFLEHNNQRFGGRCLFVLLCLKYTHTLRLMHDIFTFHDKPIHEHPWRDSTVTSIQFGFGLSQMRIIYFDFMISETDQWLLVSTRFIDLTIPPGEEKFSWAIVHHVQFSLVIASDPFFFSQHTHCSESRHQPQIKFRLFDCCGKKCLICMLAVLDREEFSGNKFIVFHCCCVGLFVLTHTVQRSQYTHTIRMNSKRIKFIFFFFNFSSWNSKIRCSH